MREENVMVTQVQLHSMRQDQDKTIHSFGAHLSVQAGICNFWVKCFTSHTEVNYTENTLCGVLTQGIANNEIQLDLLGDKNQGMTLEDVFQFIEGKEAGKQSVGCLLQTQVAYAARIQYHPAQQQHELKYHKALNNKPCSYCGKI